MESSLSLYLANIPPEVFLKTRKKEIVLKRRQIIRKLRDDFQLGFCKIGEIMGLNHATVHYLYHSDSKYIEPKKENRKRDMFKSRKIKISNEFKDFYSIYGVLPNERQLKEFNYWKKSKKEFRFVL